MEKFVQIWTFSVHEKWKNGLPEVIWSKIGHFSSLPEYCLQYHWKEKTAYISLNVIKKAIFPPFIYQKVLSLLELSKNAKKYFDLWPKLGLKITKSQNLCRISIELFLKHTIVHETKFHSFFVKQIFWAIISDTFWLFEHSVLGSGLFTTVWKFEDFSVTQILLEIKFGEFRSSKNDWVFFQ